LNKIWVRGILVVGLAALAFWGWGVLHPGPEAIIRKRLLELARAVSKTPDQGNFAMAANALNLPDYFSRDVELMVDFGGRPQQFSGRDELIAAASAVRSTVSSLSVSFPDIKVTLAPDRESAVVNLTAEGRVKGEKDLYVQEMKVLFKKIEGEWRITRVETVKTLT
jgi:hypothetical protein